MQTHVIGCLYDIKSEVYMNPHLFRSSADFIRNIQIAAKQPDSMIHKFPSDFELVLLGSWDESAGIISTEHKKLGSVLDLCPLN